MLNNNFKNNTVRNSDPNDLFNKKKLAEDAKRENAKREEIQKQQEKSKLQMQISNLERELVRLNTDLNVKNNFLSDLQKKKIDAEKNVSLLEGQIKKQEGTLGYLGQEAFGQDISVKASEADLQKTKDELAAAEREVKSFELEYQKDKDNYADLEARVNTLREELVKFEQQALSVKREVTGDETQISTAKSKRERLTQALSNMMNNAKQALFGKTKIGQKEQAEEKKIKDEQQEVFLKKRIAEQLEQQKQVVARELDKLKRDKEAKEREVAELKRKRDMIR